MSILQLEEYLGDETDGDVIEDRVSMSGTISGKPVAEHGPWA